MSLNTSLNSDGQELIEILAAVSADAATVMITETPQFLSEPLQLVSF